MWVLGLYESERERVREIESERGRVQKWREVFFTKYPRDLQQKEIGSECGIWPKEKPHGLISTIV